MVDVTSVSTMDLASEFQALDVFGGMHAHVKHVLSLPVELVVVFHLGHVLAVGGVDGVGLVASLHEV